MVARCRCLAGLLIALMVTAASTALAQDHSNRPIKLIVGFTAGGTTDFVARLIAERLAPRFGTHGGG
jgi:tripartite-type tricarboxylate transporter receptor subunit TctC